MLKKAGIVVAAAAAGLLAVSPLAFAGDKGEGGHHGHGHSVTNNNNNGDQSEGLVNVSGNNVNVPIQACHNQVPVNVLGVQVPIIENDLVADLGAALGILGGAEASTGDDTVTQDDSCNQKGEAGDAHVQD